MMTVAAEDQVGDVKGAVACERCGRERGRAWTTRNALARACGADDELGHDEEEVEEGEGRLRR